MPPSSLAVFFLLPRPSSATPSPAFHHRRPEAPAASSPCPPLTTGRHTGGEPHPHPAPRPRPATGGQRQATSLRHLQPTPTPRPRPPLVTRHGVGELCHVGPAQPPSPTARHVAPPPPSLPSPPPCHGHLLPNIPSKPTGRWRSPYLAKTLMPANSSPEP